MSQGYDQFFKKAKENKSNPQSRREHSAPRVQKASKAQQQHRAAAKEQTAEEFLRDAMRLKDQQKAKSKGKFPKLAFAVVVLGFAGATTGYFFPKQVKAVYEQYGFGVFGEASAASEAPAANPNPEKSAGSKPGEEANSAAGAKDPTKAECPEAKGFSEEELSHFNKLNDRKKELDLRETELTALEEELHKQKGEVEARIAKLEQIREEVATTLKDRVEVDQARVSTLVDFYSNMKPKQAADIFAKLNEDLAVEVLGKMKKKNAADIMNLLDPSKARVLSEKFTGYKRD